MKCGCDIEKTLKILAVIITLIAIIAIITILVLNCQNKELNILTAFAKQGDNPEIGIATIKFSQNEIVEGNAITHEEGTSEIKINETGFYRISYQLFGAKESSTTFNFNAVLLLNNTPLTNTTNDSPVLRENASNRMTLTSSLILKLNAGDIIQLQGFSLEDIVYDNARIDINKL